jgi:hypothetical protein
MEHPCVDLTIGPCPAPEVALNPVDGTYWLTFRADDVRVDVTLKDRDELRALIRSALAAAAASEPVNETP